MRFRHVRMCAARNGGDCDCWDYESLRLNLCYACTTARGEFMGFSQGSPVPYCRECFEYELGLSGDDAKPYAIEKEAVNG